MAAAVLVASLGPIKRGAGVVKGVSANIINRQPIIIDNIVDGVIYR